MPWWRGWAAVALACGVLLWWVQAPVLTAVLRWALPRLAEWNGLEASIGHLEAGLGRVWIFRDVVVMPQGGGPSRSGARVREAKIAWSGPMGMLGRNGRLFSRWEAHGLDVVWERPPGPPSPASSRPVFSAAAGLLPPAYPFATPRRIVVTDGSFEAVWPGGWAWCEKIEARLEEGKWGLVKAGAFHAEVNGRTWELPAVKARALLARGALGLTDASLRPGLRLENLWVQPAAGGAGFEVEAEVFGGMVRGGGRLGEWRGKPGMDAAFWAAGMSLAGLAKFFGVAGETSGRIEEARLVFRGRPGNWQDAEASLHFDARDVRRGQRGWDRLEISSTLVNRRLSIPRLALRQGDNSVLLRGEAAVSGSWAELANSPLQLELTADIADLAAVRALVGWGPRDLRGRMSVAARLGGRMPKPTGFLSIEASKIEVRGMRWDAARLETLLRNGEARLELFELARGSDVVTGKGVVGLSHPHEYSGQLTARISQLGNALPEPWEAAGSLDLRWQGDGRAGAHSGAFQAGVEGVRTPWTPAGLTGRFSGTYSPESLYLGGFELEHERLKLSLRATLANSGIHGEDLVLRGAGKRSASGEFYLPLDFRRLLKAGGVAEAILADKPANVRLETQGALEIGELFRLWGRNFPGSGRIEARVQAGGPASDLEGAARIKISGLRPAGPDARAKSAGATFEMEARAGGQRLAVDARFAGPRGQAAGVALDLPWRWHRDGDGVARFVPRGQPLSASLSVPVLELDWLAPFAGRPGGLGGRVEAEFVRNGTLEVPEWDGRVSLRGGFFEGGSGPGRFLVSGVDAEVVARGRGVEIKSCQGLFNGRPWSASGRLALEDWPRWRADGHFEGRRLRIWQDRTARLDADVSLQIAGGAGAGWVGGEVRLLEGRILRSARISPVPLSRAPAGRTVITPPDFAGSLPGPLKDWALDLRVRNASPFFLAGQRPPGEIEPDLRFQGTLARPVPEGAIELRNAQILLPLAAATIPAGRVEFFADRPWQPHLDLRGSVEMPGYEIDLRVRGPLSEHLLLLRSEPPLPAAHLLLLLNTGFVPGGFDTPQSPGRTGPGSLADLSQIAGLPIPPYRGHLMEPPAAKAFFSAGPGLRGRMRLWRAGAKDGAAWDSPPDFIEAGYLWRWE